jgi:hypothetical protein
MSSAHYDLEVVRIIAMVKLKPAARLDSLALKPRNLMDWRLAGNV